MSARLPKSERICLERHIEALFAKGRRGGVGPLSYRWLVTETTKAERAAEKAKHNVVVTEENGTISTEKSQAPKLIPVKESAPVSVMFSVPKRVFKRAWKRNLIKRRMRESYRQRKESLTQSALTSGRHIEIAFICAPAFEIPDFKTIDDAIAKILGQILARI